MERLHILLIQNYNLLEKLRARARYCLLAINLVEADSHKQYGPFAGFWDEWVLEAQEILSVVDEFTPSTALFLTELREYISDMQAKERHTKSDLKYLKEVTSLTTDKLAEQKDFLLELDERITLHRQIIKQILLVEAIDSLEE